MISLSLSFLKHARAQPRTFAGEGLIRPVFNKKKNAGSLPVVSAPGFARHSWREFDGNVEVRDAGTCHPTTPASHFPDVASPSTTCGDRLSSVIGSHVAKAEGGHLPLGAIVRIGFGSDEAGVECKERLKARFCGLGHPIEDVSRRDPCCGDYQSIADQLAIAIYTGRVERGVLICLRAIGASMLANKQPGVRAALCHDLISVRLGVQDDDMNLLVMEAGALTHELSFALVNAFVHTSFVPRGRPFGIPPRRLARVIEHIRKNLDKPLAVNVLSTMAEMSQSHFSKLFKISTGLAPHQFVLQERINRARVLLRQSNAKIVDIALGVGFENQAHFTTVFGNFVGMTPRRFQCSSDPEPDRTCGSLPETPRYSRDNSLKVVNSTEHENGQHDRDIIALAHANSGLTKKELGQL